MTSAPALTAADGARESLRILFCYDPSMVSFQAYLRTVPHALAARGHDVHILHCGTQGPRRDERRDGIWVHHRTRPRMRGLTRLRQLRPLWRVARRAFEPEFPPWTSPFRRLALAVANYREYQRLGIEFDLIETPEHQAEGLLFALFPPCPLVVNLHGPLDLVVPYWGFRRTRRLAVSTWLERLAVRWATAVVAPSRVVVLGLAQRGWEGVGRANVVRLAIDAERWTSVPDATDTRPVVLAVGEVGELKGSDVLIRAAAHLGHPDLELVFVGPSARRADGTEVSEELAEMADRLGVRVHLAGYVDRDEMAGYYRRARVVALPSRYDSFNKAGLEALAAGRPVVVSDRAGLHEIAHHDRGVIVVPAEDPVALAAALEPLLADADLAAQLGARGRRYATGAGSADRRAAQRESVYAEALRRFEPSATNGRRELVAGS